MEHNYEENVIIFFIRSSNLWSHPLFSFLVAIPGRHRVILTELFLGDMSRHGFVIRKHVSGVRGPLSSFWSRRWLYHVSLHLSCHLFLLLGRILQHGIWMISYRRGHEGYRDGGHVPPVVRLVVIVIYLYT